MNTGLVGKSYPPTTFRFDAERASAFARAVGHPEGGMPPTLVTAPEFVASLANIVADAELGLDLSRVLHGEQEYAWERAMRVGETVTAQAQIEDIRSKGGLGRIVLRTEIRDASGSILALARSTIIVRGDP
jgi:acyl dehydratase